MDGTSRKKFEEELNSIEENLYSSNMDKEIQNTFLMQISLMREMHNDTQMAHLRIDHRKDELESMKKSLDSLADKISVMSDKISKLTDSQKGIIQMFNRQLEQQSRSGKRVTVYITVISLISLIGTFGSIKGATLAGSIWKVISNFL